MNETTEKLIRELADKLGTTTEHLWGVLIRQAPISAVTTLVMFATVFAATGITMWLMRKYDERDYQAVWWWLIVGAFFMALCLALSMNNIVAGLFNPEYWALKQLIK